MGLTSDLFLRWCVPSSILFAAFTSDCSCFWRDISPCWFDTKINKGNIQCGHSGRNIVHIIQRGFLNTETRHHSKVMDWNPFFLFFFKVATLACNKGCRAILVKNKKKVLQTSLASMLSLFTFLYSLAILASQVTITTVSKLVCQDMRHHSALFSTAKWCKPTATCLPLSHCDKGPTATCLLLSHCDKGPTATCLPLSHCDKGPTATCLLLSHCDKGPTATCLPLSHCDKGPTATCLPLSHCDKGPTATCLPLSHSDKGPTATCLPLSHSDKRPTATCLPLSTCDKRQKRLGPRGCLGYGQAKWKQCLNCKSATKRGPEMHHTHH